jgi:uncharacterized membrane-anchored protein YjiN (DUF445 family)
MSKEKKLGTKYLKILTTKDQREIINLAIENVMKEYQVKEGRAIELISAEFLSGNYLKKVVAYEIIEKLENEAQKIINSKDYKINNDIKRTLNLLIENIKNNINK